MEHKAPKLCFSSSRSPSTGCRHPLTAIAEPVGLPLSASSDAHQGPDQAASIQCPALLMAQPWFPDLLDVSINQPQPLLVTETLFRQLPSDRFHLDPGRQQLHAWRLSVDHLVRPDSPGRQQRGLQPQALSTKSIYDEKWCIFCAWCGGWETNLFSASIPLITEFLTYLFWQKQLAPDMVGGRLSSCL